MPQLGQNVPVVGSLAPQLWQVICARARGLYVSQLDERGHSRRRADANAYLGLELNSDAEADRVYALLTACVQTFMKMHVSHVARYSATVSGRMLLHRA